MSPGGMLLRLIALGIGVFAIYWAFSSSIRGVMNAKYKDEIIDISITGVISGVFGLLLMIYSLRGIAFVQ
jgi:hypothetical protein